MRCHIAVGDIKQEPGSPLPAGEEAAWGETAGRQGDCLYDIVSTQTRYKQDTRSLMR